MKAAPTVQPLLTFGQCLKNILGARKLSASALSRMMEQKSRNSMFRILDDTGGPAVQAAFFESLKASDCLHLTEQEERELERALEVSRFGVAGYITNQAMHRLLGDVDLQAAADDSLRVDRSRDGSVTTLRESMERLAAEQKRVHFVITGCCYRRVLERIAAAFAGSACEMSIEHYLYTGGDEIIGCVSAIQPVLYLPDYKGYCIDENMFNIQREQVYRCNTITAHCEDAQGQKQVLMAVMIDPQRLLSIGSPDERNIEIVERMMREDRPKMHPIKSEFQMSGSPEGYLAYTKSLQRLEQGRSIYDIKLDVPINFVAPEVLVGPARDGFAARKALETGEEDGLFADLHLLVETPFLGQIADAVDVVGSDLPVAEQHAARVGRRDAVDDADECSFAGTVRPQQTHNLTLLHINGNMAYNGSFTVLLNQVFRAEHHLAFFHILVILRQM